MNRYLILPFALSIPYIACAQNEKMRENVLNPVIITGTGTYHKAENSPVEVKVISTKELKAANVTNLQEALGKLTSNITISMVSAMTISLFF